MRSDFKVWKRI